MDEHIKVDVPKFTYNKNQLERRDKKSPKFVVVTFYLANDYRALANKLIVDSDSNTLPSPIAMLYAFSCELFLKALIKFCDKNGQAHGHELKGLFHEIRSLEIKETIKNAYNKKFGNDEQIASSSLHKIFPVGFEDTLAEFNTAFEKLRYENEYIESWEDSTFLPWFADTLYMVCEQKQLRVFGVTRS